MMLLLQGPLIQYNHRGASIFFLKIEGPGVYVSLYIQLLIEFLLRQIIHAYIVVSY